MSLMSLLAIHVLIWSRNRCSFLICVLRSCSSFSFCVWFDEAWILSKICVFERMQGQLAVLFLRRSTSDGKTHTLEELDLVAATTRW